MVSDADRSGPMAELEQTVVDFITLPVRFVWTTWRLIVEGWPIKSSNWAEERSVSPIAYLAVSALLFAIDIVVTARTQLNSPTIAVSDTILEMSVLPLLLISLPVLVLSDVVGRLLASKLSSTPAEKTKAHHVVYYAVGLTCVLSVIIDLIGFIVASFTPVGLFPIVNGGLIPVGQDGNLSVPEARSCELLMFIAIGLIVPALLVCRVLQKGLRAVGFVKLVRRLLVRSILLMTALGTSLSLTIYQNLLASQFDSPIGQMNVASRFDSNRLHMSFILVNRAKAALPLLRHTDAILFQVSKPTLFRPYPPVEQIAIVPPGSITISGQALTSDRASVYPLERDKPIYIEVDVVLSDSSRPGLAQNDQIMLTLPTAFRSADGRIWSAPILAKINSPGFSKTQRPETNVGRPQDIVEGPI